VSRNRATAKQRKQQQYSQSRERPVAGDSVAGGWYLVPRLALAA